ncbi:DUF1998 domain-containing protein [Lipingzhangella sp. LS1_29]|uniref:DUF1998 domain-containing protein n=1 Tax=Lipingzhangella rawalii TaxID=2055835 RepID=A0ABU2HB68_9ACTN|nr:DUF1998 domain-containing protein [Lipingzhangella rawalii]MDS1271834.1 DUF1998 domain-containing protein [Lipingzhangella rawalii]
MAKTTQHRRRVGTARPSHLMFTSGVGALVDLPNFSALVSGIDDWNYDPVPEWEPLSEPRLLNAVSTLLDAPVSELRTPPWRDDASNPEEAARVGVPTIPFPQWLRCTACNRLAKLDSGDWGFTNELPRQPDKAHFHHANCSGKKNSKPLAVPARFVLACTNGHLDDFPYVPFVHKGDACPVAPHPRLTMRDRGGNQGPDVLIKCVSCSEYRPIRDAMGERGRENLPRCRGRHPHLGTWEENGCGADTLKVLAVGASNQWFPEVRSALAMPPTKANALDNEIEKRWDRLVKATSIDKLEILLEEPRYAPLNDWALPEVWEAIERRRAAEQDGDTAVDTATDLRTPEWEILSTPNPPNNQEDFALRRDPDGVPASLRGMFADVVQVERIREVRALVGFTRLDAPDPEDPELVQRAPLSRGKPSWVPASEVRGEGIFLRVDEDMIATWEQKVATSPAVVEHREAYRRFRQNRYSGRISGDVDPLRGWPGPRYLALHTLSHLVVRTIALECGYNAASLSERIYAQPGQAGILIYTAVPDAEGTLGGLVSLAEPEPLQRLLRRALADARRCSSDPLCAERLPRAPADLLHGAACHVCLFVSETTCERGNRFLDRRFVVPIDAELPPLWGEAR